MAAAIRAAEERSAPPLSVANAPTLSMVAIAPVEADHTVNDGDAAVAADASIVAVADEQNVPRFRRPQALAERRADADLKVARRSIVAGWKGALTRGIGLRQARQEHRLKRAARQEPT